MAIKSVVITLNGTNYTIPLSSGTTYQKTITAPASSSYSQTDHVYPMTLTVTDAAGNVTTVDKNDATFGDSMKLRVKEKVAPTISVTSPSANAYLTTNSISVSVNVTDTGSGVNTVSAKLDGTAVSLTKTAISNGYKCTCTKTLSDAVHTLVVTATDFDGNTASKTVKFTVDTVPPMLNVSSPAETLITNKQTCAVTGTTNDATSGLASVNITLNGTDQGTVTVGSDGAFTKSVTLAKGENTIIVTATDKAGKSSTVSRSVTYDPDAPVILSIDVPEECAAGENFTITVVATD